MAEGGGGSRSADFALVVYREDGRWQAGLLPDALVEDLEGLLAALRQQPAEGGTIGLVNVADEFFVAARVGAFGTRLLLSDVTAALDWDLAEQVCDHLGIPVPEDDDLDDVRPVGDLGIFADLGVDEMEMGMVLDDLDAYADEQLSTLAVRLGFADAYDRVLGAIPH